MLSIHGLVIIAGDNLGSSAIISEYKTKTGIKIKIFVSSESPYSSKEIKMDRYPMSIWVPMAHLEEARSKLIVGKICEIVKGSINPLPNQDPTRTFNVVNI